MRAARIAVLLLSATLSAMHALRAQPDSAPGGPVGHVPGRLFLVTNIGPAVAVDGKAGALGDWGLMINTEPRAAIGASYSASLLAGKFEGGPALRMRWWLGARRALDIGVGWGGEPRTDKLANYSPFGLVEYRATPWIGFAVQASHRGVLVGVQLGSAPGLIASLLGAAVGALGAIRVGP